MKVKSGMLEDYIVNIFPRRAAAISLRFIDGNFRAGGWQGNRFSVWLPNKKGTTTLIDKGNLRRSFHYITAPGQVYVFSNSPYAFVHNRGFVGIVSVKAHTRYKFASYKVGTGRFNKNGTERTKTYHTVSGTTQVAAHTRKMNIPKRQFMPEDQNDSPVFNNAIKREITRSIQQIFQP